ncbi:MAG TPA: hypothetical protein VFR81_01570 [Longimicrobium sp.]|nr:hypothetical protein [Longimicrobium sp.]
MTPSSPRSLRRAYLEWVEEQVEEYKDSIPRSHLLSIAEAVVEELRVTRGGQYQLTELMLCGAVDRYLVRMLKLPGYRAWVAARRPAPEPVRDPHIIPIREILPAAPVVVAVVREEEPEPVACVV